MAGCAEKRVRVAPDPNSSSYRIAVIPFESSNPYLTGIAFSDCFTVRILREFPGVQVIERKDLMKILQEQKLALTGALRQEKFLKLGSILGVEAILTGSIQTLETLQSDGGAISVTVKLMEVQTGKVLWADRRKISHSGWFVREVPEVADILVEKAARKMAGKLERALKPRAVSSLTAYDDLSLLQTKLTSSAPR
jgi:TolB-like protein